MEDALSREYAYPPCPICHGLEDDECDYDAEDYDGAARDPFE